MSTTARAEVNGRDKRDTNRRIIRLCCNGNRAVTISHTDRVCQRCVTLGREALENDDGRRGSTLSGLRQHIRGVKKSRIDLTIPERSHVKQ
ncbi:hypothetical protein J6590_064537 [Homalodisca vitripennis]|nr:hypothetical protein J6590_064537 [Homalodisca vitripennis]